MMVTIRKCIRGLLLFNSEISTVILSSISTTKIWSLFRLIPEHLLLSLLLCAVWLGRVLDLTET
jgi:hypothetical protein